VQKIRCLILGILALFVTMVQMDAIAGTLEITNIQQSSSYSDERTVTVYDTKPGFVKCTGFKDGRPVAEGVELSALFTKQPFTGVKHIRIMMPDGCDHLSSNRTCNLTYSCSYIR
jgi:hypothetical protein